jgi:hypothetical protein
VDIAPWPVAALVDDVLVMHWSWRESADAAVDAYADWPGSPAAETHARFAAYTAALDQEQASANAYAEAVSELKRWLGRARLTPFV